ncbi:MBL fold metallo-hydrolase [Xanthocytophaga agilis]|uniref:MBL fold metallo-hydrolase n=1 Tax=Xanthocytophaga agilis TaxID=3048010 RepID=A0AAE3UI30_9BACT|nr:MBL fold metallo-hydrolase [Xanthocytophaga agilis]MDJ1504137.1 MBL fold metallo-hydrolase [Xanthocytophaga agilis]
MDISIQFLGAVGTVTGSKYLLTAGKRNILVDCGMFQGLKELRLRNWQPLPVNVPAIDTVVITHAHIDHIGYLPRLYREGFRGQIICTKATKDLMRIMLLDSARLQEEEAEYATRKGYSKHPKPEPLYYVEDVESVMPLVRGYDFNTTIELHPEVSIQFRYAGHILGAASIEMFIQGDTQTKKIVFSGDLGRYGNPVLFDPSTINEADVLLVESTYGDKESATDHPEDNLARIINETLARKGCIIIPSFAVGRSQTILHYLQKLEKASKIPPLPIYLDSPMAVTVSELYAKHLESHKLPLDHSDNDIFFLKDLHYVEKAEDSKNLNTIESHAIIVASSGMCEGGRIVHHLFHRLPNPNDTLLLVGYQAEGTRGRRIQNGEPEIRMFGHQVPVNCKVESISGLSGHADRKELVRWLSSFQKKPKKVFIVHGEPDIAQAFSKTLKETFNWDSHIPAYKETAILFEGV